VVPTDRGQRRRRDGGRLLVVGLAVGCGLLVAGLGCSQPVPEQMSAAGGFFRPVGPVSIVKLADRPADGPRADRAPPAPPEATEGGVPTVPDSKIRLDLGMRLAEAETDVSGIEVRVDDQVAILEGTVDSHPVRDRIELIAREVTGVRAVDNRLEVGRR